ncbi:MAG: glycosyltransferase family 2 protein [Candidatus Dadabacteria bacterium]|nr:MAG: glycosyltransferase family 2 protein [Candidatus Dadabacteria bacterium]
MDMSLENTKVTVPESTAQIASTREIYQGRKVVAVLPAYNLEDSIAELVRKTKNYVDECIVVADGSKDKTGEAARSAGAIVPEPENVRGKGFAVRKGFREALRLNPDVVVLMDADGQHLPEEIPQLVEPIISEQVDMVVGSRMLGTLRTSTINKFGNWGLKIISFLVTWKWMTDTETGFRVFKPDKLSTLNLSSQGYEIESELLLKALHKGFKIKEVPITVPFAVPGVTVWDGFKVGWYKIKTGLMLKLGLEKA